MSTLLSIGVSHKTAPVALRERIAVTPRQTAGLLATLVASDAIQEVVCLSTCNRSEILMVASDPVAAESAALDQLTQRAEIGPTELSPSLYTKLGPEAAEHIMRVAAGLDSMVLGESEILGQLKRAFELAQEEQTTGPIINRLIAAAIGAGKRVHSETTLGHGSVSLASVAVDLARETLGGDLSERSALIVGSGEHGALTARALGAAGVNSVFIANRHYSRAIGLAESIGGRAVRFEHLPEELAETDIVLGATGSPHTLIHLEEMREVMAARDHRPLLMIDTAVPRDFEPSVGELDGLTLLDIDDLQASIEGTLSVRRSQVAKAETLVAEEVERFEAWIATLEVIPTIAQLRARGESIAEQVVAENAEKFSSLTAADRDRLAAMADAIVARMLHEPTLRLKAAASNGEGYAGLHALRELFGLESVAPEASDQAAGGDAEVHQLSDHRERGGSRG